MGKNTPHSCTLYDLRKIWSKLGEKHRVISQTMFYLGLRFSEVRQICRGDLDFYDRVIWIRKQKNATLNERYPMPSQICHILQRWSIRNYRNIKKNSGLLFPSNRRGLLSASCWCDAVSRARRDAGLDGDIYRISSAGHACRRISGHSAKAALLQLAENKGLEFRQIQALGHHKSWTSTIRYLQNPTENFTLKKLAVNRLF